MRTSSCLTRIWRLWRDRRGVSAVEFALVTPIVLMVMVTVVELGRGLAQSMAIEKGLRAGSDYATRANLPLDASTTLEIENIVKTGTIDGTGSFVTQGWGEAGADLSVGTSSVTTGGQTVTVIRLSAEVPMDQLLPGLLSMFNLDNIIIRTSHEQVHIGR